VPPGERHHARVLYALSVKAAVLAKKTGADQDVHPDSPFASPSHCTAKTPAAQEKTREICGLHTMRKPWMEYGFML
jgi:hypothetical protein